MVNLNFSFRLRNSKASKIITKMVDVKITLNFVLLTFFHFVFKVSSHQLSCYEENLGRQGGCKVTKGVSGQELNLNAQEKNKYLLMLNVKTQYNRIPSFHTVLYMLKHFLYS